MNWDEGASRRGIIQSALGAGLGLATASCATAQDAAAPPQGMRLLQRPTRVFKAVDLAREGTEAWFVMLIVEADAEVRPAVRALEITHHAGANEVKRERYAGASAEAMAWRDLRITPTRWPLAVRLIGRERAALNVDRLHCVLELDSGLLSADIALDGYTQQTELIFPFRGQGIITQGGAANAGHRNASGQFAIDAMGLSEDYAVQTGANFAVNTDLSGFGRPLLAPAAGVVAHARGDRPDQPVPGESNPQFVLPEFVNSGDPGNHLIIDHGNGEFSMIAHLMAGSLAVREGEQVRQGQEIGRLGNSGDSFAPHVHYQLQDGLEWQSANGLPCRFSNVAAQRLDRGEFFVAR